MGKATMGAELIKGKQVKTKIEDNKPDIIGSTSSAHYTYEGGVLKSVLKAEGLNDASVTLRKQN